MRAASEDFTMARLLGVRANRVIAGAFALSGILAAVATVFLVTQSATVYPKFGVAPVIIGFIATALGGMGSLLAATLGAYVLGAVTVALQVYLPTGLRGFRDAFVFGAIVAILLIRPDGLLVSRARRARV
jgi:branched-chain amino acid transport system permease protein